MRIVSLIPSATEMLFALGLGSDVIAVTHECDYPPAALELPNVTRDVLPPGLSSAQIDAAVKERTLAGESIYELDVEMLRDLRPDLIVTQALCSVCAVSYEDVRRVAEEIDSHPRVVSLDPHTVGEVLGDARTLAQAADRKDAAVELVRETARRIDAVRVAVRGARRPRVAALEWLDPPYAAGHWTPQLIEYAGGEDVLGFPGEHSEERSWEEVRAAQPDVVIVMPCGFDAELAYRLALRVDPKDPQARTGYVAATAALAHLEYTKGTFDDALATVDAALQREPVRREPVAARHRQRARHADDPHDCESGECKGLKPSALGPVDDDLAADQPGDQPAEMAPD